MQGILLMKVIVPGSKLKQYKYPNKLPTPVYIQTPKYNVIKYISTKINRIGKVESHTKTYMNLFTI